MPNGVVVRHASTLNQAKELLRVSLQDAVVAPELRPFLISRLRKAELMQALAQVKNGIFGFDNVLHDGSQWKEMKRILGPSAQQLWQADLAHRPINGQAVTMSNQIKGRILCMNPEKQSLNDLSVLQSLWTADLIHQMIDSGVTREQIRSIAEYLPKRAGACELVGLMSKACIISWGFAEAVESWLEANGISQSFRANSARDLEVGAAKLLYGSADQVSGVDRSSVVVNANKGNRAVSFREHFALHDTTVMSVGDSIYDLDLMTYQPISLQHSISGVNVMILPPTVAMDNLEEFSIHQLEGMWKRITCVLVADDFQPLVDLLQRSQKKYDPNGNLRKKRSRDKQQEIQEKTRAMIAPRRE